MPGGVAGAQPITAAPYADLAPQGGEDQCWDQCGCCQQDCVFLAQSEALAHQSRCEG